MVKRPRVQQSAVDWNEIETVETNKTVGEVSPSPSSGSLLPTLYKVGLIRFYEE